MVNFRFFTAAAAPPALVVLSACASGRLTSPAFLAKGQDGCLFVTDVDSSSVRVFAEGANGNVAPIQVISGPHTELHETNGIALRGDRIFVASNRGDASRINVFGTGSNGDVAPIRTIKGPNTGLDFPRGVAVDERGYIYVSNIGSGNELVARGLLAHPSPRKAQLSDDSEFHGVNVAVAERRPHGSDKREQQIECEYDREK